MSLMFNKGESLVCSNILYYDAIAAEYDQILNDDKKNLLIREAVAKKFIKTVREGYVLDFGGGTGRDFAWLIPQKYHIVFCEPSRAMRLIAMERTRTEFPEARIHFFEEAQADFRNWIHSFPFGQKMDAVLANFAVFNCIPDINVLFEKLALAVKQGGHIIALVMDDHLTKRLRSNTKGTIKSFFSGKPVTLYVDYKNQRQEVYLYSTGDIRRASGKKFELVSRVRLEGYGFRLIHLVRK
jgi:SAM-dependent methyltransferase